MGGIGSVLAFLVGGWLADQHPRQIYPFAMAAAVMLLALAVLLGFVREPAAIAWRRARGLPVRDSRANRFAAQVLDAGLGHAEREPQSEGEADAPRGAMRRLAVLRHLDPGERRSLVFLLFAIFFWFAAYNAVETFFTLYATNRLGVTEGRATMMLSAFSLSFVVFALPSGKLAERIGRLRLIRAGLVGLTLLFVPMIAIENQQLLILLLALGGACWAAININSLPMVVELATGRTIGSFTGFYYFFSFSAAIVSPILFGFIRDLSGNYATLFIYAPVAFVLAFICMLQVRHGDNYELRAAPPGTGPAAN